MANGNDQNDSSEAEAWFAGLSEPLKTGQQLVEDAQQTQQKICQTAAQLGQYPPGCPRPGAGSAPVPSPPDVALQTGLPPDWLPPGTQDTADFTGPSRAFLTQLWREYGITPGELTYLSQLDPAILATGQVGADLASMDPKQQQSYMEAQHAVAVFANYNDRAALEAAFRGFQETQEALNWARPTRSEPNAAGTRMVIDCEWTSPDGQILTRTDCKKTNLFGGTLVPRMITDDDIQNRMNSILYQYRHGGSMAFQNAIGEIGGAMPSGQQALWSSCLEEADKEAQVACLEQYEGQTGVAELIRELREPWTTDPDYSEAKLLQRLTGNDGKTYYRLKVGQKDIVLEGRLAIGGLTAGLVALGAGGYMAVRWLRSPAGKRWRRRRRRK